jgi:hypothetical protein
VAGARGEEVAQPSGAQESAKVVVVNGHHPPSPPPPSTTTTLVSHVMTNPGPEYWRNRNPVADDIVITDVTVNLSTVTIRECKTGKGFFRDRHTSTDIK